MLERDSALTTQAVPPAPGLAPASEPPTPLALWPTFMRRTLAEDAIHRSQEQRRDG
jgi:hypothetical protein